MKKLNIQNVILPILSFIIPFIILLMLFASNNFYPFSKEGNTVLMIDAQGQYIAFYRYYKTILSGDSSAIYTMGKALGGDMMSIFTYYLASPFYLLFTFIEENQLPTMLLFITILKISCAGLTSYFFIKTNLKNDCYALLFAISYSLISYNFVYHSNLMWLDGVYLLPLTLLGIKELINDKKPILYIISLALSLYCSWYIGYMICIFVILFFISEVLVNNENKSKKELISYSIKFIISSLLGGLISSFTWMSAFTHLQGTKGGIDIIKNISENINQYFYVLNIFRLSTNEGFLGFEDITNNGMHMYVGATCFTLLLVFFVNKNIKLKHRLIYSLPLLILLFAFINVGVDMIMHGGAKPTWFPFRYAFIYGLYVVYLSSKTFNDLEKIHPLRLLIPLGVLIILSILSSSINSYKPTNFTFISFTIILLLIVINYYFKKIKWVKPLSYSLLFIFNIYNMYTNSSHIIETISDRYLPISTYEEDEPLSYLINQIKKDDTSLYRLEKTFMRKGSYNGANNDSMYYSYNGLSHYSSNEKKFVSGYLSRIGFHYNGFWENYGSGSTLSMNSFLGVKYILTSSYDLYSSLNNTSKNTFVNFIEYKPNYFDENTKVYENPYALPFLMVVNSNSGFVSEGTRLEDNKTHWFDHFEYQNQIFKTMVNIKDENGNQKDIFKKADYTINTNIKYRENENGKIYEVLNVGDTITFTVKTDTDNPYYYGFRNINNYLDSFSNKMQLYINNNYTYHFSYYNSGINGLPLKNSNQTIKLRVNEKMTNRSIIEEFYYEDLSILKEYIETIKTQNVKEEKISSNKFTYKVNVLKDNQQLLFTLPYEDNFVIKVDGKEVKSKKSYHIFLGADISKGLHTIEIEYVDKGLKIGSIISAFSLITSALYIIYYDVINLNINKLLKIKKEETK